MTIQQDERLVSETSFPLIHVGPHRDTAVPDVSVSLEKLTPVACFGGLRQIALTEGAHAVVGNPLGRTRVVEERLNLTLKIAEVSLNLNVVLIRAVRYEKIVMVLDIL